MTTLLGQTPWWAPVLAAAAYYFLGAAWFSPLFGRAWDRSIGYDRSAATTSFPVVYYVVPLASAVVVVLTIASLAGVVGVSHLSEGATLGAGVGIAVAAASMTNALTPHTPRPFLLGVLTGGYHLVGCVVAGALLGASR